MTRCSVCRLCDLTPRDIVQNNTCAQCRSSTGRVTGACARCGLVQGAEIFVNNHPLCIYCYQFYHDSNVSTAAALALKL